METEGTNGSLIEKIRPGAWLVLVTVVIVAAFMAATLYTTSHAAQIDAQAREISGNADPSIRYLSEARTHLNEIGRAITSSVLVGTNQIDLRLEVKKEEQRLRAALDAYSALPFFPSERERWLAVDLDVEQAEAQVDAVLFQLGAGDQQAAGHLRAGPMSSAMAQADSALGVLIAFDADQGSRLGKEITAARHDAQRVILVLDGLAVLLAVALGVIAIASIRLQMRTIEDRRQAGERRSDRLRSVGAAAVAISEHLGAHGLQDLLQTAVDQSRLAVGADMAALGVGTDPARPFDPFVFSGIDATLLDRLGAPRPIGLLGAPLEHRGALRIDDVAALGRLPDKHPPLGPLLAVSLRHDGSDLEGVLYMARKPGAAPFTEEDASAVELLAEFLATAMQRARLYGSLRDEVRAREDMLALVSHDLRNPLSSMSLATDLALRAAPEGTAQRRQLEVLARNLKRMDRMIGDLLTAAKLQEGRLEVEARAEDAGALACEVVDTFAAAAADKKITLRCEVSEGVPPVLCDAGRVTQCLNNLVGNAIKFTPERGRIVVQVGWRPERAEEVTVSVRDTGGGIPEGDLPHVFDRYWQRGMDSGRGNGLGLFICKGVAEAHGGRIWVASRVGEGSEFTFTLPAVDAGLVDGGGASAQPQA